MSFGFDMKNGFGENVISDRISMVKGETGVATYDTKSGDTITAANGGGKNGTIFNTTVPFLDEMYGGPRRTLYFFNLNSNNFPLFWQGLMFTKMNVGEVRGYGGLSRLEASGQPRSNERIGGQGIISSSPTIEWAMIKPRPNTLPTGFGMAVYGSDGACRWAADDEIAWTPYVKNIFMNNQNHQLNVNYNGWMHLDIYYPYIQFDGNAATCVTGHFSRPSENVLHYSVNPWWQVNFVRDSYPDGSLGTTNRTFVPPLILGNL